MSTVNPLVSVIMPIKDCNPKFFEKSIESILNQTLSNLELIIVIESTEKQIDVSLRGVLEKFKNEGRIKIIRNKGKGFVEALNSGILASRGSYIGRMDGDDVSHRERLEKQVKAINELNLDLVGGWAYVIDENGSTIGELKPPTDNLSIRKTILLHNPFLHSTILFKKSILLNSGLYNKALYGAEDYDLWLRIVSLGYAYANLPEYVLFLRETRNSVMRGRQWRITRINYAKVKALAITRLGYHDPLSVILGFSGPFSLLIGPKMARNLKVILGSLSWSQNKE